MVSFITNMFMQYLVCRFKCLITWDKWGCTSVVAHHGDFSGLYVLQYPIVQHHSKGKLYLAVK